METPRLISSQSKFFDTLDIPSDFKLRYIPKLSAHPFAATSPTTLSITTGSSATFTCTVGGFPIESVTISGPHNVSLDCLTTQTSGNVSCTSSDQSDYVVIVQNFKLEYAGDYTCTVGTKLYKADNTAAVEYSAQDQTTLSFGKIRFLFNFTRLPKLNILLF